MKDKELLSAVFSLEVTKAGVTETALAERVGVDKEELAERVRRLRAGGRLETRGTRIKLTRKGRSEIRVVFVGGGFEIIHPGHIHTLEEARKLGDVLVAIVARDSTIRRRKGREPVSSESDRVHLLGSLRQVDAAMLGAEGDIYTTLERVRPDVVALGYDQHHTETEIIKEAEKRGMSLKVVRLDSRQPGLKTSRLLLET